MTYQPLINDPYEVRSILIIVAVDADVSLVLQFLTRSSTQPLGALAPTNQPLQNYPAIAFIIMFNTPLGG